MSLNTFAPGLDAERERAQAAARKGEGNAEILEWCPVCVELVTALRNGTCPWCDTACLPERPVEPPKVVETKIPPKRDRRHNHGKPFTADQIVARIQLWARVTGAPPTKREWSITHLHIGLGAARARALATMRVIAMYQLGDWPSDATVREHFTSWNAALVAAGFEPRPTGRPVKHDPPQTRPKPTFDDLQALFDEVASLRASPSDQRARVKERLYELAETAIHLGDRTYVPKGSS